MNRSDLPIMTLRASILETLQKENGLILQAPTGSGKSTQVPQFLLEGGLLKNGEAVVLQPRRLASRMLAERVAEERGSPLGEEVGYQIRFENISSKKTRVRFVTEGILLRQMLHDPTLPGVKVIIFDEFHERNIYTDLALAQALALQETRRPDLKLIVMSATLDTDALQKYLPSYKVLQSEGRTYQVQMHFLDKPLEERDFIWNAAARILASCLEKKLEGDVLIFMSGAFEIHQTMQAIRSLCGTNDLLLLPLHGELSPEQQNAAMKNYQQRKVIVSTNVAETSLTIDGVRIVIDSGLARIARYDAHRGINTLWIEKISRASADQRAGRAGRTAPGHTFRLWTEREDKLRVPQSTPEVKRIDLAETILWLHSTGVSNVTTFPWFEAPEPQAILRAETLLDDLGALEISADTQQKQLTETGRRMLAFPTHPRHSRLLLMAETLSCVREAALMIAILQERNLLLKADARTENERERLFPDASSDVIYAMQAWEYAKNARYDVEACRRVGIHARTARQIEQSFEHFLNLAKKLKLPISDTPASPEQLQKCLLAGFVDQIGVRADGGTLRCHMVHGRTGTLQKSTMVSDHRLLVATEMTELTTKGNQVQTVLSMVTAIEENWLKELFPEHFSVEESLDFDPIQRRVVTARKKKFQDLILESETKDAKPSSQASALLCQKALDGTCSLKGWDDAVDQWIIRLNALAQWCPELKIPAIGADEKAFLIEQLCEGAVSYKEIKEKPLWPVLKSWLSTEQALALEKMAPDRFTLPSGRNAKITYFADRAPVLSTKIQDLYDAPARIPIAMGKVSVCFEILAPNFRPIQTTSDLEAFWKNTYPELKKELQRRYPKHAWR